MSDFRQLIIDAELTTQTASELFGVTERTVANWIRFDSPQYAAERLSLRAGKHRHWVGFKLLDGFIKCSNGDHVNRGQIEMFHWTQMQLLTEVRRNVNLRERLLVVERMGTCSNDFRASNLIELANLTH